MKYPDNGAYIEPENLGNYARKAAETLSRGDYIPASHAVKQAAHDLEYIGTIRRHASLYARERVSIPQEVEWLLDNWYIAERESKSASADIKAFRSLPRESGKKRRLLVSEAARILVRSGACEITAERLYIFLDAFQDELRLSEEELGAFIPAVRLELLSALAGGCHTLNLTLDGVETDGLPALFGSIFTSLRFLSGFDALPLLEDINRVERALRLDPSGIYEQMDDDTRRSYRRELSRLARLNGVDEQDAARYTVELAQPDGHIGHFIFTQPLGSSKKKRTGSLYIGFVLLASLFFTLLISFALGKPAVSVLLLFPVSEIIKNVTDYFVQRFVSTQRVERLELESGVPAEGRTLCAVSILLSSASSGAHAATLLEEYRISNRDAGANLMFALLADLPEAKTPETPRDDGYIESAADEIRRLNAKYGGGFFLLYRKRVKNERDGVCAGWERKRGAILELCRYLRGRKSGIICPSGDALALKGVKYVLALDSDTRLSAGTARELIGAAMHPLNRPIINNELGVVTGGSGIIQPRVSVSLSAAGVSDFTLFFAGQGGIDPYGGAASDLYQNMFGTGSFTGKGILDIDAYLACLDTRFPENRVLSHDLLEGAYLRCAYAGDIELTDGFPSSVKSYYSRMHRWTRGDWQAIPWLFKRVKNAKGGKIKNPLPQIDKWKIADNLRRSLVPPFLMAALLLGMLRGSLAFIAAFAVAVLTIFLELVISGVGSLFRERSGRVRYISKIVSGFGGQLVRTIVKLMLLPFEAWVCLSAIATAVYRMCLTKKRLLEWTTAADSERRGRNNAVSYLTRMWPCLAAALCVMIFSPFAPAWAAAIVWALTPLYAYSLGREKRSRREISGEGRLFLSRCAGDQWRYFEELLTPEDNYLPPDNFQEQPSVGIAHRTSPTNIGLALISALAAIDLGACKRETALSLIANMLDTINRLPKWRGHLYNWYDTTNLSILSPAYVSTVDCGNLAGCLIALRAGLLEHGEKALAETVDRLLSQMSFTPFYDEKRQLFYIGWDTVKDAPSDSWYDLLASEAMLTSYIAIARGDVPRKHWRRLGRALVSLDGYRGMASWTGTMFEYLMPELLLPCFKDSLIYESLKFCVFVQKKRSQGRPWGMSESAFYDFDHTLSYRYKAHGVGRLALKRGMDRDTVISPYSTFLALAVDLKASLYNLRRLQLLGAEGRYGFFEALDYTPSRLRKREFELVKTYMAHHIGMSLISIDNVLNNGIMQKRFLRDREMSSFTELLQEKVPVGGIVLRQPPRDVPDKPLRAVSPAWSFETEGIDKISPRCCLIGNGAYTVMMAETGLSRSVWNGVTLTRSSPEPTGRDSGMMFFLYSGGELIPLLPSPVFNPGIRYGAEMSGGICRITAKNGGISSACTVTVPEGDAGELRTVEITSNTHREAELICYFEPVLSRLSDYESHPAFSKLSLETSKVEETLIISRRPRVKGHGLALAFGCDLPFGFDTSRESALGRGGILSILRSLSRESSGTLGAVLDPCVLARVKLRLEPDTPLRVKYALAPSTGAQGAAAAVRRILDDGGQSAASRLDGSVSRLGLTLEQTETAMLLLSEIVYPSPYRRVPAELSAALAKGQRGMWSLGISGDFPILTAIVTSEDDLITASELIKTHTLLVENGAYFDLVFLLKDGGDYRGALKGGVCDLLRSLGLEWKLGARCGVHTAELDDDDADIVTVASFRVINPGEKLSAASVKRDIQTIPDPPVFYAPAPEAEPEYGYNDDGSFFFEAGDAMPPNAWSHMLANDSFGYLASDAGTGHMWHVNARENKINRWLNDSLATEGTERLSLVSGGRKTSLFSAPDGFPCRVTYGFGFARWEKTIGDINVTVTAFVPPDIPCRVLLIEANAPSSAELHYYTDLVLGESEAAAVYVETTRRGNVITARNAYSADFSDTVLVHAGSVRDKSYTCSKTDYLTGKLDGITGAGFIPCIAAAYPAAGQLVLVSGCADVGVIEALADVTAARQKLGETIEYWRGVTSRLTVKTPSDNLNRYLNGWVVYQTLACRVFGRSSLYQSGGAYGFRDQLQDVCALLMTAPEEARAQIIRAAEHQYFEGDVQHWWHPGTNLDGLCDKGVRTKCSDDLLWLPYTLCEYIEKTGDDTLCAVPAQYLKSQPLQEDETERYEQPQRSDRLETIFTHAMRAIDLVLSRGTGHHGLCLIGGGDWNDGMNLVGADGKGESVWLTWFLIHTAERFAELCNTHDNPTSAERYISAATALRRAAENAWDGSWYLRGYFDDGTPLGSAGSEECRIDSIAQSFAALAGADTEKVKTALTSTVDVLFNREMRVIMLFDPPFSSGRTSPGYIKGYSPGFRENGGQYTHGAVWLSMALLMSGMTALGRETLEALLPQGRINNVYRTEPYVLAADVYSNERHLGRGGWTWYTGASGWFLRVAAENLLGLRLKNGVLCVDPKLPPEWDGYEAVWKNGGAEYLIKVGGDGHAEVFRDGKSVTNDPAISIGGLSHGFTEI